MPSPRPPSGSEPEEQASPAYPPARHDETDEARRAAPPVPTDELACRARLRTLGVDFSDRAPIDEAPGCVVGHPLAVASLGQGIDIAPQAVLNCATAEATARFLAEIVVPASKSVFGEDLVAISHGSAFVCRPRNGTTKLSEHAFANAIDIGGFKLASGRIISVAAATDPKEADFLSRVRMAACGPFKTVLGPGTDPDHAQHFHFDLAKRRNGGTYCR
ncbi:MAG TPA: extensin family protein [Rhizobiaceae bacterium]|nr:extensin family protein [Rhizobiaceae bacterium]